MAIKVRLGRLETDGQPFGLFIREELARNTIALLDVTVEHADRISFLPLLHRDPFDRMFIAQAMTEGIPIISADSVFDAYPVSRIW
jgi:PIN domain nuclease of toxin-antitoxin system